MTIRTSHLWRLIVALLTAVAFLLFTPTLGNLAYLTSATDFYIPRESSVFTFAVTKWNEGSGEYWLYGEDFTRYYNYFGKGGDGGSILKSEAKKYPHFDPQDYTTWPPR